MPSKSPMKTPTKHNGKDNIYVCVRMRPCPADQQKTWKMDQSSVQEKAGRERRFNFERVYNPDSKTDQLYKDVAAPVVHNVMEGINGTIFAYGQTASGKTHTILGYGNEPGVIPLAIQQIFDTIGENKDRVYLLRASYLEIYNEQVNDLLAVNNTNLVLRENKGKFLPAGATETVVTSPSACMNVIQSGNRNRAVGRSNLNEISSRSHSIFRMVIESEDAKAAGGVRVSELNLVDLAGSETLTYEFGNKQQSETKAINSSLTMLKSVIEALSKGTSFVPYRNSVLTKILKNSLGGNAKTVLICTASPADEHCEMTVNTLRFGSMAKIIKNNAKVNETFDNNEAMLRVYKNQISGLEAKLDDFEKVQQQKAQLQRDYESLQKALEEVRVREEEREREVAELQSLGMNLVGQGDSKHVMENESAAPAGVSAQQLEELSENLSEVKEANLELNMKLMESEKRKARSEEEQRMRMRELERKLEREKDEKSRLENQLEVQLESRENQEVNVAAILSKLQEQLEIERAEKLALAADVEQQSKQNMKSVNEQAQKEIKQIEESLAGERAERARLMGLLETQTQARQKIEGEKALALEQHQAMLAKQQLENAALARERDAQQQKLESTERRIQRQNEIMNAKMKAARDEVKERERQLEMVTLQAREKAAALEASAQEGNQLKSRMKEIDADIKASGMDRDGYLASMISQNDHENMSLRRERDELANMNMALKIDCNEKMAEYERRLQAMNNKMQQNSSSAAVAGGAEWEQRYRKLDAELKEANAELELHRRVAAERQSRKQSRPPRPHTDKSEPTQVDSLDVFVRNPRSNSPQPKEGHLF